jgi:hypothetical protein
MTIAEILSIALAAFGVIGALTAWVLKSTVAPIKVSMDGSTRAIDRLVTAIDKLDDKLDDHDGRINRIEMVHRMRRCDDGDPRDDR